MLQSSSKVPRQANVNNMLTKSREGGWSTVTVNILIKHHPSVRKHDFLDDRRIG